MNGESSSWSCEYHFRDGAEVMCLKLRCLFAPPIVPVLMSLLVPSLLQKLSWENGSTNCLTGQSTLPCGSGWTRDWIVRGWGYSELSEVIIIYVRNLETPCNDINFIADRWRQEIARLCMHSCSWQQLEICSALNSFNSVLITSIHGKKTREVFNACLNSLGYVVASSLYSFPFPTSTLFLVQLKKQCLILLLLGTSELSSF